MFEKATNWSEVGAYVGGGIAFIVVAACLSRAIRYNERVRERVSDRIIGKEIREGVHDDLLGHLFSKP